MDFINLAKKRYSCRSYQAKKVEEELLRQILEAAHVAPTGANFQPQRLFVVQDLALDKLKKAANIYSAPLAIIVCCDTQIAWTRQYDRKQITDIDASIVTDHMMLQATDLGLDSLWICSFNPDVLRTEFSIPDNFVPVNILAIGYGDKQPQPADRHLSTRNLLSEIVFFAE